MSSIRDFFPINYNIGETKPRKNFILENRKYVTKLSKSTQVSKENEHPTKQLNHPHIQKNKEKYEFKKTTIPGSSIQFDLDKIDSSIKSIRSAIAQTKITQEKLDIKNHKKVYFAFKDQATQTINPYDENDLLNDGVIKYPKVEKFDAVKIIQKPNVNTTAVQTDDFKCTKQQDVKNPKMNQPNITESKENVKCHQPGEIPKYLKNRKALKEKNEKEIQKKLAIQHELGLDDPACPPGHVLLPELERLDHLTKIKKDYNRLITQYNKLPVSSDSYKTIEKRKHLEKELDKLQLGIKLFSRKKLFVRVNPMHVNFQK